jgi:hypothetical protein
MSGASNIHGRCTDSAVWVTYEEDNQAMDNLWRDTLSSFPVVGGFIAGMVPDTLTMNAIRSCPGATIDHTTGYRQTYGLMALTVMLLVIYIIIPKK